MARPQPQQGYGRQPRHFGAAPLQYMFRSAVANAKAPLVWFPEMVLDIDFPHVSRGWCKGLGRWRAITDGDGRAHGAIHLDGSGRWSAQSSTMRLKINWLMVLQSRVVKAIGSK